MFLFFKLEISDGIFFIKNGNKGLKLSVKYIVERFYGKKKYILDGFFLYKFDLFGLFIK